MAIADNNERLYSATKAIAPALSDSADVASAGLWRGLFLSASAEKDVAVVLADDTAAVTFTVQPGAIVPVSVRRVMSTGTTAVEGEVILLR